MVKICVVVYQFSSHDCLRGGRTGEVKMKISFQLINTQIKTVLLIGVLGISF